MMMAVRGAFFDDQVMAAALVTYLLYEDEYPTSETKMKAKLRNYPDLK